MIFKIVHALGCAVSTDVLRGCNYKHLHRSQALGDYLTILEMTVSYSDIDAVRGEVSRTVVQLQIEGYFRITGAEVRK
ncbi:hypothetical protein HY57_13370 [Dyella japonica A8]|uniref:Uncharacterized protein n=1 Tax=Dyella japonica A8 TaxID=1217721 RepID=A0A075K3A4_9GAMM|nr:hypothetical protein HY57_13370 [Dyella japonica A8]